MAVKIMEESNVLTLDFWEDEVIYEGKAFPAGTLACHALNIPDDVISRMETLCKNLNCFMGTFDSGKGDAALLPAARQSALKLFSLMLEHKPFSYINAAVFQKFLQEAKAIRRQKEYFVTDDTGDVVNEAGVDHYWNYVEILCNGIQRTEVQKAFDRLTAEKQYFLEARNAICMYCGKVDRLNKRLTFDQLGEMFEFTTANGAEKAYHRAVDQLARNLAEDNAIRIVTVRKKDVTRKKKKIAAAIYEYQADCDGEWGEIQFDFEAGTAQITYLADWETTVSHVYAKKAIEIIFEAYKEELPKEKTVAFER